MNISINTNNNVEKELLMIQKQAGMDLLVLEFSLLRTVPSIQHEIDRPGTYFAFTLNAPSGG